ncbi:hypothetical protein B0F90DRAFT_1575375, partial [Multifurca ochricompacta]
IEEVEAAMKQDMALADEHVKPMRQVLSKLRRLSNRIKNSSTLILPRWKDTIKELAPTSDENLTVCMMPRDVCTRWNSTYDMLKFAYKYREVVDKITSERSL